MSAPPLTFLEKKWAAGWQSNLLHQAATQTTDRKSIPFLDYDPHRNVSNIGRRVMMSLGRWLFANFPTVRGALLEQAEYASSHFLPQFRGAPANQEWGRQAEAWLFEHGKICDLAGWPFNMRTYRRNLILGVKRDGDVGTLLTQTAQGYPMLQTIPAHRIASRLNEMVVEDSKSPYDGARIIDGVIVDEYFRPLAYRVIGENPWDYSNYRDIAAKDMFLSFVPEYPGQLRGFTSLGSCLFDFQDVQETRGFERLAQKMLADRVFVEENEMGEPDPSRLVGGDGGAATPPTTNAEAAASPVLEQRIGGSTLYFRSGSGSKLTPVEANRPSASQQEFESRIVRSCLYGMGWSVDFSLDPSKVGGASMRIVVERINRFIAADQDLILEPACRRYDGYALAKVMKNPAHNDNPLNLLPWNDEWWKFEYQGPALLTADKRYNSDVDLQERRAGMKTLSRATGERGEDWQDVRAQIEIEARDVLTRAKKLSEEFDISIEFAMSLLETTELPKGYSVSERVTTTGGDPDQPGTSVSQPAPAK